MLKYRLLMSALLIPATIGLFVWDHHLGESAPVLLVLVLAISTRCVWELVTLARTLAFQPSLLVTLIATWLALLTAWWPHLSPLISNWIGMSLPRGSSSNASGMIMVILWTSAVFRFPLSKLAKAATFRDRGVETLTLSIELMITGYVGFFLATTCQLRWMDSTRSGYFAIGSLVVATKMGDVGAYTFGRLIGGPKMTPKLSPGKTWAGGVGHLVTAGLCSVVWLCWLGPMISSQWLAWSVVPAVAFGVIVGFAGLIGDLAESLIKRDVGVKDAPALLPGFGGLIDLMDSILLAGPVAYAMWHLLR